MGLFDIFRRKKKDKEPESAAPESAAAESQAPESAEASATAESTAPASEPASSAVAEPGSEAQTSEPAPASEEAPASESAAPSEATADKVAEEVSEPASEASAEEPAEEPVEEPTSLAEATSEVAVESATEENASVAEVAEPAPTEESEVTPVDETPAEEVPEETSGEPEVASAAETTEPAASEEATTASEAPVEEPAAEQTEAEEAKADDAEGSKADAKEDEKDLAAKYDRGLAKSRTGFGARLNKFLANFRHVDEDFFEDLEDLLIESDVGFEMTQQLSDALREEVKLQNAKSKQQVSNVIIQKMVELYEAAGEPDDAKLHMAKEGPTVLMFVGVNGAGKTTTIGKLAARFKREGKRVLLVAADTFRAGATEQLEVWAERDGVDIVTGPEQGDPAAVVFDGVQKAKQDNYDILLVDTAGRLQNKVNLMNELAKMKKILTREIPEAPHEVLLVLDSTTGQNALNQAKLFKESTDVTGIVLTKLDGTARGGIVLAIQNELHLPVKFVGLGEQVDDLEVFDPAEFVYGLFKGLVVTD